jgi:hypothetical protein
MRAGTSAKSNSGRSSVGKSSKTSATRSTKQKAKWKVVDGKVEVSPGEYSIEDLEAMLKAIQRADDRCATRKGDVVR